MIDFFLEDFRRCQVFLNVSAVFKMAKPML